MGVPCQGYHFFTSDYVPASVFVNRGMRSMMSHGGSKFIRTTIDRFMCWCGGAMSTTFFTSDHVPASVFVGRGMRSMMSHGGLKFIQNTIVRVTLLVRRSQFVTVPCEFAVVVDDTNSRWYQVKWCRVH